MSEGVFAKLYDAGAPFALIDTRERRDHVDGHWFGSTNIPLSVLSDTISCLVPDRTFPVHLFDWQDPASQAAADLLAQLGYSHVTRHPTSRPSQFGSGFVKGEYVWSKAFGEVVAHCVDFPEVTPADYVANHQGAPLFDVRPTAEYRQFTIPGSQSLPNSLILAHMTKLRQAGQTALLHCAGRTRSIIGACTLKAAGFDGDFAVFRGGTQAWQLDGYDREHDADRRAATDGENPDDVLQFLETWQIRWQQVAHDQLAEFTAAHADRLLFDVSDDAATGQMLAHGITRISGTNLIQQTDRSIARYHVPVVLFDTGSASRAAFAAFWLAIMGFEVKIARLEGPVATMPDDADNTADTTGKDAGNDPGIPLLTTAQLLAGHRQQPGLVDLRPSASFSAQHLAGSEWRNISAMLNDSPSDSQIILVCGSHAKGCEAAALLAGSGWQIAGIHVWQDGAYPATALSSASISSPVDESALFAGRHHGNLQDARDYLDWEEALPDQIDQPLHILWQGHLARVLS